MFNLLPQQEQKEIFREYHIRLIAVALFFTGALIIIAIASLIPSLFLSNQKELETIKQHSDLEKEMSLKAKDDYSSILKDTSKKVVALQGTTTPFVYELINNVIRNKSTLVKITGINTESSENGTRKIIILGQAKDRDSLVAFSHALERNSLFSSVTVPVSNFADAEDINFSMLVKVK